MLVRTKLIREVWTSNEMIVAFSRICGDKNPVHLDPVYAAKTRFRSPIAHGMTAIALLNSMIPSGKKVQHYEIRFIKPIYPLDKLQAVLEINYEDKFSFLLSKLEENEPHETKITSIIGQLI